MLTEKIIDEIKFSVCQKKKSFKTYARLITSFSLGFIKRGACMAALPSAILPLKRWIKNNSVTAW